MPEELDDDHPQMQEALRQLRFRIGLFEGLDFTPSTLNSMWEVVAEHRKQWRLKGVAFPELVGLAVARLGIFDLARADLEPRSIAVSMVNFVRNHPGVTMMEALEAFGAAFAKRVHIDDMRAAITATRSDMARRMSNGNSNGGG